MERKEVLQGLGLEKGLEGLSGGRSCLLNALVGGRKLPNSARIGRRGSLRQKAAVSSFVYTLYSVVVFGKKDPIQSASYDSTN